jgi:hypothetical protein
MSSDIEESAREGMRQFTATMRVSPDLAARTCQRHRRRTRHKLTALATGAGAVAAGAALAMIALAPASHPASRQPGAQLAAWTVVKQADGNVYVTIRQFRDPAGLQARLRADGVPASVIFNPGLPPGAPFRDLFHVKHNPCQAYSGGQSQLLKVVRGGSPHPLRAHSTLSIIHLSALPSGAGVQYIATPNTGDQNSPKRFALGVLLVQTSPKCTGS